MPAAGAQARRHRVDRPVEASVDEQAGPADVVADHGDRAPAFPGGQIVERPGLTSRGVDLGMKAHDPETAAS
jgi:hypothetical protein